MTFFLLYIDPGTGSMLFSIFIGIASAAIFFFHELLLKAKLLLTTKRKKVIDKKNIPFVIFSDHKRYWNIFKPICDEFEKHKVNLSYFTASMDDPALFLDYKYIHAEYLGENNKPFIKMNMLHADIVLSTTPGLAVFQWKRSRHVKWYVHIPHTIRSLNGYRMFGIDHYDAVVTANTNQILTVKKIEYLRPNIPKKEFVVIGSPIMDSLKQKKISSPPLFKNKRKIVVVAPSWGKSGILTRFGEAFLSAIEKTEYEIIIRPHPQSITSEKTLLESLENKYPVFQWNYDNDNFTVLNKADILISDFSGTIFEFVVGFNKPIIYTDVELDKSPYDAAWLEDEMWELRTLPKIGVRLEEKDFDKIGSIIAQAIENKHLQNNIEMLRKECWENVGHSAEACYNYLVSKQKELQKSQ